MIIRFAIIKNAFLFLWPSVRGGLLVLKEMKKVALPVFEREEAACEGIDTLEDLK